jgi:hypothetical protein
LTILKGGACTDRGQLNIQYTIIIWISIWICYCDVQNVDDTSDDDGEVDVSVTIHVATMKGLLAKSSFDEAVINDRMKRTYKARRLMVEELVPLDTLLEEYPALKSATQVYHCL